MDKNFETHKATLLLHADNFWIIDFRREDDKREYFVRFIIDTNVSSVHIEGDLGYSISIWGNSNSLGNISDMMLNVPYWVGKLKSTGELFYISDVLSDKILLKKDRKGSEICVSYQDFADGYCWNDSMWPTSCTLCGWDSQIYEIVEEPIYDKGVRWGTERIVKRREV